MAVRRWIIVVAARPNFMKIAPLIRAIMVHNGSGENIIPIQPILVHTGQHYDDNMSEAFIRDLNLPEPDICLGIGSGSHAKQTGLVMIAFEEVLLKEHPDLVIVVGDVNSTMACALAAVKLHIPVAHVEAGLRSFDRTMPEEINRLVTDAVADYLFTPSFDADENLLREGIPKSKIFLVGDIMVDSLLFNLAAAKNTPILERLGLSEVKSAPPANSKGTRPYALVTLHRPANVDNRTSFGRIVEALRRVASLVPVIFPMHPRTLKQVKAFGLGNAFFFHSAPNFVSDEERTRTPRTGDNLFTSPGEHRIHAFEPLGYLDFLNLMAHAAVVLTDSGGVQEETTVLNIPCITLRDTTERPITLTEGTNVLVRDEPDKIFAEVNRALKGRTSYGQCPAIWDGHTAERIVQILADQLNPIPSPFRSRSSPE